MILEKEAMKLLKKMNKPFFYNPSFGDLIWFSAFKALSKENIKEASADHKYYSKKEFFVKSDLSYGQKFILKMFKALFGYFIKIGLV